LSARSFKPETIEPGSSVALVMLGGNGRPLRMVTRNSKQFNGASFDYKKGSVLWASRMGFENFKFAVCPNAAAGEFEYYLLVYKCAHLSPTLEQTKSIKVTSD